MISRRSILRGFAATGGAACFSGTGALAQNASALFGQAGRLQTLGLSLSASQRQAGADFLANHPSVDVHCHPGRFFLRGAPATPIIRAIGAPFEQTAVEDLRAGGVSAAVFAAVGDLPLIEPSPTTGLRAARDFKEGEAFANYRRQMAALQELVRSGAMASGLSAEDISIAAHAHRTACVFAWEGGDFIEDKLDRVGEAHRDGVRVVTLTHFHINRIGDVQTESPVHGGLTPFGASVVREMNTAGILPDLAHATYEVTKGAVAASERPVMISHTNLQTPDLRHPRLISLEHARLVAQHGGLIGAVPSGIGQTTFADYITSIQRLVDAVGIEHVAIGTDMDANYKPVFTNYRDWSLIPAALLASGLHAREVAALMGGNFLRLFRAYTG